MEIRLPNSPPRYDREDQDRLRRALEAAFEGLKLDLTGGGVGPLTIKSNSTLLTIGIGTLDFSTAFILSESPTGELNISLPSLVTSVTGTANQITASPTTGDVILSLPTNGTLPGSWTAATGFTVGPNGDANVQIRVRAQGPTVTNGKASLWLDSDILNSVGEPGGAYVKMTQDNGVTGLMIGITQNNALPDGTAYTGLSGGNAGVLVGLSTLETIQFGTNGAVRVVIDTVGNISMTAAASQIIPGATSFSIRNTANSADNLLLTDAGVATFRNLVNINRNVGGSDAPFLQLNGGANAPVLVLRVGSDGSHNGADIRIDAVGVGSGSQYLKTYLTNWGGSFSYSFGSNAGEKVIAEISSTGAGTAGLAQEGQIRLFTVTDAQIGYSGAFGAGVAKVQIRANGLTFFNGGDTQFDVLGTFDHTGTRFTTGTGPVADDVMSYHGGAGKWRPRFLQTSFTSGAATSQNNTDGTFSTFFNSGPALSGVPAAPGAAPVATAMYKAMLIDMSAYVLGGTQVYVLDYSINGGAFTSGRIISTSAKVIHSSLDPTKTYSYKFLVRGGSDSAYSSASAAASPSSATEANAFGLIVASQIATAFLSSINANIGSITAGQLVSGDGKSILQLDASFSVPGTVVQGIFFASANPVAGGITGMYLDFTATGSNPLLHHTNFDILASGSVVMKGVLRDTNSKFVIDVGQTSARLITIIDEQGSPKTRVKIGEVNTGTSDWGLQVFDNGGNTLLDLTAANALVQDANGKFVADLTNALLTVTDNQGSPTWRVKLGKIGAGTTDYGLQVRGPGGNTVALLTGNDLLLANNASTQGILMQGTLPAWSTYINLTASSGSDYFIKTANFSVDGAGNVVVNGIIQVQVGGTSSGVYARVSGVLAQTFNFSNGSGAYTTVVSTPSLPALTTSANMIRVSVVGRLNRGTGTGTGNVRVFLNGTVVGTNDIAASPSIAGTTNNTDAPFELVMYLTVDATNDKWLVVQRLAGVNVNGGAVTTTMTSGDLGNTGEAPSGGGVFTVRALGPSTGGGTLKIDSCQVEWLAA